jgi:type IV secretory pathway VirB10-like protein
MHTRQLLIAAALSACSCSVFAQWQWVDESGRKVFSDRPPPAHISPAQVLKRPLGTPAPVERVLYPSAPGSTPVSTATPTDLPRTAPPDQETTNSAQATPTPIKSDATKPDAEDTATEKALEAAQRKAEEAEQKKQQAQQAKARKDNCARARASQVTLDSGIRLASVNEKGERGFMSDAQRQAEMKLAQKVIKESCS